MMEIKPVRVFYLFALLGAILFALSWLFPEDGVVINGDLKLKWIPKSELLPCFEPLAKTSNQKDTSVVIPQLVVESVVPDSLVGNVLQSDTKLDTVICSNHLYYNRLGEVGLEQFFNRLKHQDSTSTPLHILHFGDSQLDGDRITRYLRELFQDKFGGSGCGLVNCLDPVKQISSVWINSKGNWSMNWVYDEFRQRNDKAFGLLGSNVSGLDEAGSSIVFTPSQLGNPKCRDYQDATLFVTPTATNQIVTCFADKALYQTDTLKASTPIEILNYHFPYAPHRLEFSFEGNGLPILNGCLLDAPSGIQVDNIALRGQLFTRFLPRDSMLVSTMAKSLNPALIILQFGANLLPTKAPEYSSYQRQIEHQISLIKSFIPSATIMVVGVGDAAERVDGVVVPLCSVKPIAEAQKRAALNSGALFFDLLTAMGGEGTMVKWADEEPKRALTDYIHYNPRGGKEVAKLLFTAIDSNFQIWCNQPKANAL